MKKLNLFSVSLCALLGGGAVVSPALAAEPLLLKNAQITKTTDTPAPVAEAPLAAPAPVLAAEQQVYVLQNIVVTGQQRIEPSTVLSYLGLRNGQTVTMSDMDEAMKRLYETGFFRDMKAVPQQVAGNQLVLNVSVVENPLINRVAFEGNKAAEDKDLEKELDLKSRSIFTRAKVQSDTKRIVDIYRRKGRYSARVEPKIVQLDQNRVDLVYEIEEGPEAMVRDIRFIGNNQFTSAQLREAIRTEEAAWYKFLSSDDTYDQDRLQYDQELMRRFYLKQGYADFQIKSAVAELNKEKDSFFITFTIDEGQRYRVGDVSVNSNVASVDPKLLQDKVNIQKGDVYNASEVETTVDALVNELGDKGFAFVNVNPDIDRKADERLINLAFNINEGPKVYVERIDIKGNARTVDKVIRREFRLAEGDPYSSTKLKRTEQRLNNLGYFSKVAIANEPGSAPDRTVINVDVEEQSTGEISLGGGFSSVDGVLADFGIRESNLLGRGQDLRLKALLSARRQQYDIGFTEPYFLDRDLAAGVDLFKMATDFTNQGTFNLEDNGGRLRFGYSLGENLRHNFNYSLHDSTISDVDPNASVFIKAQQGNYLTSAIGQSFNYDTRNNRFQTTSGTFLNLVQDLAGLGGDVKYLRHEVQAAHFVPIAPKWTWMAGGSAGNIFGLTGQNVRLNDRYFIGQEEIRGFALGGIGPRDTTTRDALGGNNYYAVTTELQFPVGLPDDLGVSGAIFTDAANLWEIDNSGAGISSGDSLRVSAGVGVAWASPFGPIRLDVAKAIAKEKQDDTQLVRFSFGTRF